MNFVLKNCVLLISFISIHISLYSMDRQTLVHVAHLSDQQTYQCTNKIHTLPQEIFSPRTPTTYSYKALEFDMRSNDPIQGSLVRNQTDTIITVLQSLCSDPSNMVNVLHSQLELLHVNHTCDYINAPFNALREQVISLLFDVDGCLKNNLSPQTGLQIARLYADFMLKFCPNDQSYFKQLQTLSRTYPIFSEIIAHDSNSLNKFCHRLGNDLKELWSVPVNVERLEFIKNNPVNKTLREIGTLINNNRFHEALALSRDQVIVAKYPHLYETLKNNLVSRNYIVPQEHLTPIPINKSLDSAMALQAQNVLDQHFVTIQENYQQELYQLSIHGIRTSGLLIPQQYAHDIVAQRTESLSYAMNNPGPRTWQQYELEAAAQSLLNTAQLDSVGLKTLYGDAYQQQLQSEFVTIVNATGPMAQNQAEIAQLLCHCAVTGCDLTQVGKIEQATSIADFCWATADYANILTQSKEGSVDKLLSVDHAAKSTMNALSNMIVHCKSNQPLVIQKAVFSNPLIDKLNDLLATHQSEKRTLCNNKNALTDLIFVEKMRSLHEQALSSPNQNTIRDYLCATGRGLLKTFNPILHPIRTVKDSCRGMAGTALHYFRCAVRENLINHYIVTDPDKAVRLIQEQCDEGQQCINHVKHLLETTSGPEKLEWVIGALAENFIGYPLLNKAVKIASKTAKMSQVSFAKALLTAQPKNKDLSSYIAAVESIGVPTLSVTAKAFSEAPVLRDSLKALETASEKIKIVDPIVQNAREFSADILRTHGKGYYTKETFVKAKPYLQTRHQNLNGNCCVCTGKPIATSKGKHQVTVPGLENYAFDLRECEKFSKVFDYTFTTPEGIGVKKPIWIDYEHILGQVFNKNCDTKKFKLDGFHHDYLGKVQKSGVLEFTNIKYGKNGVYQVEWIYQGVSKHSTFFPKEWTPSKVIQKIEEALKNNTKITVGRNKDRYVITGLTKEGIEIEIVIDLFEKEAKIVTAYPSFLGALHE